jgi:lysophospholipid acyltransferase (LPLAT)-like uncharacterized protein
VRLGGGFALWAVPRLAALLIRGVHATLRVRHLGREPLDRLQAAGETYIHAFWHGRLLLMPFSYRGRRITILISQHRDGEYIARTMEQLGFHTTRGSTTRGGAAALRQCVRRLREGYDLGITPDGPLGPRHEVQAGVIEAARLSGAAIVPVAFGAHPGRILDTWDGFLLPWPFGRAVFRYGEPLRVPKDASAEARRELAVRLQELMRQLTQQADEEARGWR